MQYDQIDFLFIYHLSLDLSVTAILPISILHLGHYVNGDTSFYGTFSSPTDQDEVTIERK